LSPQTRQHLLATYGSRASDIAAIATTPELQELIDPETGAITAEVHFAIKEEMAQTLQDILMRRTMIGLNRHVGRNSADTVAHIAAPLLNWDATRTEREIVDYQRYTERFHPRNA
jgi:glycerol-3-phosphate dehydrogenase